jgi:hypothetical protein
MEYECSIFKKMVYHHRLQVEDQHKKMLTNEEMTPHLAICLYRRLFQAYSTLIRPNASPTIHTRMDRLTIVSSSSHGSKGFLCSHLTTHDFGKSHKYIRKKENTSSDHYYLYVI